MTNTRNEHCSCSNQNRHQHNATNAGAQLAAAVYNSLLPASLREGKMPTPKPKHEKHVTRNAQCVESSAGFLRDGDEGGLVGDAAGVGALLDVDEAVLAPVPVSYTHLTLPTIYSV